MKTIGKHIAFFLLFTLVTSALNGRHLVGGSLTYEFLGKTVTNDHKYRITLTMYRDAANPRAPEFDRQISIGIYQDNQPYTLMKKVNIGIINQRGKKVKIPSGGSQCSFQPNVQIFKKTYQTTVELPPSVLGYHLVHIRCCRNNTLLNLIQNMGQTYHAYIPPTNKKNSSPTFSDIPAPYICSGDKTNISYQATDPDGDSLAYKFKVPFHGGSANAPKPGPPNPLSLPIQKVTYSNGYNFNQPFGNNGISKIDHQTGLTTLKAPQKGRYALAVEVEEYRNGKLLSKTRRDIQIIVLDCPDNPRPDYFLSNKPDKTNFTINEGETLNLDIKFKDSDSMKLIYDGPVFDEIAPPRATMDSTKGKDTVNSKFTWHTQCGQARNTPYIFSVIAKDQGCPPKQNIKKISINVQDYDGSRIEGADSVCTLNNQSLYTTRIGRNGKDSVDWTVTGGKIVKGQNTDSLWVDWQNKGAQEIKARTVSKHGCKPDTATFKVQVFKPPYGEGGPDKEICSGDTTVLGPSSLDTSTQILWLDSGRLDDPRKAKPRFSAKNFTNFLKNIDLRVRLTRFSCQIIDTVTVTVNPKPEINGIKGDPKPCFFSTNTYEAQSPSAIKYHWFNSGGKPKDTVTSNRRLNVKWTNKDSGTIKLVTENQYQCHSDSFQKDITIENPKIDTIYGTPVVCPNTERIRYWVDSNNQSNYHWQVKRGKIVQGQGDGMIRVNWSDSGSGHVKVVEETKNGCFSDTFMLPIKISYQLETSPIFGDTSVCEFSTHPYHVQYTNGSHYDWWARKGQINKLQPSNEVSINWGNANGNGMLKVLETSYDSVNDKLCKGDTVYQPVRINPLPDPSNIKGPDTLCQENKGKFKISGFPESKFKWDFNNKAIDTVQAHNDSITLKFLKAGNYTLKAQEITKDSCLSPNRTHTIFIKEKPEERSIQGLDTVCSPNEMGVKYNYNGDSTSTFIWKITGGKLKEGQGKRTVSVDWLKGGQQSIRTIEKANNGCSGDTVKKPVTVDLLALKIENVTTIFDQPSKMAIYWDAINNQFFPYEQRLMKKDSQENNWSELAKYGSNKFQQIDPKVKTKRFPYNYQVRTKDLCRKKVESRVHRSILLASEKPSEKSLKLHWTPYQGWGQGNVEHYEIYRRVSDSNSYRYKKVKTVPGSQLSAPITKTNTGLQQCYRVKALKNGDHSVYSWSNETCKNFPPFIYVPNAFSPWDKNGVNDKFRVKAANLKSFKLQIYTRWGERVFETTDPDEGWDGTYKGKKAPAGTYLVKIRYQGYQLTKLYSGTVHLLR